MRSEIGCRRLPQWWRRSRPSRPPPNKLMARKEGLIGRKIGMTQVFGDDGNQVPVTVIEAGPCTIVGIRAKDTHGYDALQLGFGAKKKHVSKPEAGLFKKADVGRTEEGRVGEGGRSRGGADYLKKKEKK